MSQIKIPSAPLTVSKMNVGHYTWVMRPDKNRADMILSRVALLPGTGPSAFDGREYLEAFMAVGEPEDALTFLNRFGCPAVNDFGEITFSEFRTLQNVVRTAALTPLSEWPPKDLSVEREDMTYMVVHERGASFHVNPWRLSLRWDMTPFAFVHETYIGIEACCAQVFFEKLSGVEFRWCARPDCNEMFRKQTGHDKIYCTPECAHLAAVRASRARASETKIHEKRRRKRH
jgi:hypothetical protein